MQTFLTVIGVYFIAVNLWGLILMRIDKKRAERNFWRVSEFGLFIPAFFGGTIGCLLGMYIFHHKTRHPKFTIGMPVVLCIQAALVLGVVFFAPYKITFM